jgi:diguanylate cyclase (GGDEF)-like protein/PAS domain S-box-containing protein
MNDSFYKSVVAHSPVGYAYHRIICNNEGNPCDYEFIEVNPAFEKFTGLIGDQIVGKRITHVLPEIIADEFDWIGFYGDVALNGGEKDFEQYTEALKLWCRVSVYSPKKGYFATHFVDITREKNQYIELNNFFELNLDFMCIADTEGNFLKINKAFEDILGYSDAEMMKAKYLDFVHPDDVEATRGVMAKLDEQKAVANFINRYRAKDGSYHYIEWSARPQDRLVYGVARDITERKKMEQILERRMMDLTKPMEDVIEVGFKDLFDRADIQKIQKEFSDATGVASVITFPDGTPITEPSNFTRLCRDIIRKTAKGCENCYKSDAVIGTCSENGPIIKCCLSGGLWDAGAAITVGKKHIANWLIGQVRDENIKEEQIIAYAREIEADEAAAISAFREVPRMSRERFEKIAKLLYTLANQLSNFAYQTVLQARFINEKRQMEEIIFNEKELFKTTLLSVGDGVIATDKKGNVMIINQVAEGLTGWSQNDALGKPLEEVFRIKNEFTGKICENPQHRVLTTGKIVELDRNTILVSRNNEEIPIEDSAAPIKDEEGNIKGMVLVFRDFTDKRQKENEILFLSYHDYLTGLYNRRFYEEELERLDKKENLPLTLLLGDVNGLKLINDTIGHAMGDELLKKAAQVIRSGCRENDVVARLGGDEFVVILPNTDIFEIIEIIEKIREMASREMVGGSPVSISFGHETKEKDEQSLEEVFKRAEDDMYRHKQYESPNKR